MAKIRWRDEAPLIYQEINPSTRQYQTRIELVDRAFRFTANDRLEDSIETLEEIIEMLDGFDNEMHLEDYSGNDLRKMVNDLKMTMKEQIDKVNYFQNRYRRVRKYLDELNVLYVLVDSDKPMLFGVPLSESEATFHDVGDFVLFVNWMQESEFSRSKLEDSEYRVLAYDALMANGARVRSR